MDSTMPQLRPLLTTTHYDRIQGLTHSIGLTVRKTDTQATPGKQPTMVEANYYWGPPTLDRLRYDDLSNTYYFLHDTMLSFALPQLEVIQTLLQCGLR